MMTPADASRSNEALCRMAPVIPVLVIEDVSYARPLAEALVKGGLPVLEVTLRTPAALDVIREMASVEGGVVGAGTLLTPEDVSAAIAAGARDLLTRQGIVLTEIGPTQGQAVAELFRAEGATTAVLPDLDGRSRVVSGRLQAV